MLKKIILLFLITLPLQANLFSMESENKFKAGYHFYEFRDTCFDCYAKLNKDGMTSPFDIRYVCSGCNQPHIFMDGYYYFLNKTDTNPNEYNKFDNNTNSVTKDVGNLNLMQAFILNKIKYLVPASILCLIAWKYSNQIKKILLRK